MTTDPLVDVIDFVAARQHAPLSTDDLARVATLVLDAVGCQLGGASQAAPLHAAVGIGGCRPGESTEEAAFSEGVALRDLDFLDVYASLDVCHPAENIPVARVMAERQQQSGRCFLHAVATAYEVQCRLADALDVRRGGLHHTTMANVTVPILAACLGELAFERLGDAISLALSRGLVIRSISQGKVSEAKAVAFPMVARGAWDCVRLAEAGVSGPSQALIDLVQLTQGDPEGVSEQFRHDVEASPRLGRIRLKPYPVQYALQAIAEAGIELRQRLGPRVRAVTRVDVRADSRVLSNTTDRAKRKPANRETADHSLYAVLAMALDLGRLEVQDMRDAAWERDEARRLAAITTSHPATPSTFVATAAIVDPLAVRVSALLDDGTTETVTVSAPLGGPSRPLSDDQVTAKFRSLARPVVGDQRSEAIISTIKSLPERASMVGFGMSAVGG